MNLRFTVMSLALAALPVQAEDFSAQVTATVEKELRAWSADPALIAAIKAANVAHAGLSQDDIDALDKTWRAETQSAEQPMISAILALPESRAMLAKVEASQGRISEVFAMDEHGLNVAQAHATSDYWQGDEAKYQETYPRGPQAVHVSEVEFDESSQTYQVQASFTVTDPDNGAPIGAITVGLNAEMIE